MQTFGWSLIPIILAARIIFYIRLFSLLQDLSQQGDTCCTVIELITLVFHIFPSFYIPILPMLRFSRSKISLLYIVAKCQTKETKRNKIREQTRKLSWL